MVASKGADGVKTPALPSSGDEIFHFRLGRELGRGAFARVFLAEQADLAGRRVVLKCSTSEGSEPQTLAQLQHTNIVPIYSVHEDSNTHLRAVCMPYFGGASLSQVLQLLWARSKRPAHGGELVKALDEAQGPCDEGGAREGEAAEVSRAPNIAPRAPAVAGGGSRPLKKARIGPAPVNLLASLSFPRAAAWVVARLADGLQHAHQRGVLHHDIKPSNILLGADGQPLLLDFNLARNLRDEPATAVLGGTVAYMSPEHLRALLSKDPVQKNKVDHRSDIYSLGMVLYEMLTGEGPFSHKGSYSAVPVLIELMAMERTQSTVSPRRKRPDVPWTLESITRKCLAADPAQRYQHAAHLAQDLRRFMEDSPLKYAPELSQFERARKWFRRHPRLTSSASVAAVAAVLLAGTACTLIGIRERLADTQQRLEVVQDGERKRAYQAGTQRALCLVNTTVDLRDHQHEGREVCQKVLALYAMLDNADWQRQPAWQRLTPDERTSMGEDARELLLLLAWTTVKAAPGDRAALSEALALLDRAGDVEGLPASRAVVQDRALYLDQLGEGAKAQAAREAARQIRPTGARDLYLLANSYARAGRYAEAIAELDQALELNPRHYWSSFQRGVCYQQLGKHGLAAGDFGTCIGLWPEFALGYFNRAYNLDQGGAKAEALRDYTAALARDPDFTPAYMNRGMAYIELKRYPEALVDFQKLGEMGVDEPFLYAGRGVALEGLQRSDEADEAFQTALARSPLTSTPIQPGDKRRGEQEDVGVRIRWVYGFAVSARLPDKAREAFDAVLARWPDQPQALYGKAMLLADKGRESDAIGFLNRAVSARPGFLEARRSRAVLQARRGNLESAGQEINVCLAQAPDSGSILYAAACVSAWASKKATDPTERGRSTTEALALLEKAFTHGYGRDKAAKDPDLSALRDDPRFRQLLP
jgi:eukaryotic-like serine/threonine-protein kinase